MFRVHFANWRDQPADAWRELRARNRPVVVGFMAAALVVFIPLMLLALLALVVGFVAYTITAVLQRILGGLGGGSGGLGVPGENSREPTGAGPSNAATGNHEDRGGGRQNVRVIHPEG